MSTTERNALTLITAGDLSENIALVLAAVTRTSDVKEESNVYLWSPHV